MQLKFWETESMQTYIDHIPLYIWFSVYARPCDCSICDSWEHIDCIMCENCKKNYYEDHIWQKFESDSDIERFLKHMKHKCSCGNKMELTENLIRRLSSLKTR
jgi:hypothetical protein